MKVALIDLETTGFKDNGILQVSAVRIAPEGGEFRNELYNPDKPIETGAMATHHITPEMVEHQDKFEYTPLAMELWGTNKPGEDCYIVAHNADFDIGVLRKQGHTVPKNVICTMKCSIRLFPGLESYSLQFLRYHFNLKFPEVIKPHDARSDVIVLASIYNLLFDEIMEKLGLDGSDMNEEANGKKVLDAMVKASEQDYFLYGKYKGKTYFEISKKDPQYLKRMLKTEQEKDTPNQDEVDKINKYL